MMLKEDHKNRVGNDKYEGYVVDLIHMISEEINITYEFKLRNDGNGKKDKKTGKWDGLIGEVHELVTIIIQYILMLLLVNIWPILAILVNVIIRRYQILILCTDMCSIT